MLKYDRLLTLLQEKGIKKARFRDSGFSPSFIYKIEHGEHISTKNIDKLCAMLQCQPGDFMEWIPDKECENVENTGIED